MPCRSVGGVSQHTLQVSRPTPKGGLRGLAGGVSPGPHPGGGGVSPACTEADPTADGYCCEWYTSYWNAFLLCSKFS